MVERKQEVKSKKIINGVVSNINPYSVDEGDIAIGDDITILENRKVRARRGFDEHNTVSARTSEMFDFNGSTILHLTDNRLQYDLNTAGDTLVAVSGTFVAPDDRRMEGIVSNRNFFFTSNEGIKRMDGITSTPDDAGLPFGLDVNASAVADSNAWFQGDSQVGYRVVFVRDTAQGRRMVSSPTPQFVLTNPEKYTVTSISYSSGLATATTDTNHGFSTSDNIFISGADESELEGYVDITVTGGTTFTYAIVSGISGSESGADLRAEKRKMVQLDITIPDGIRSTDRIEVYRTNQTASNSTAPDDEHYLVDSFLYNGSAATYVDEIPESLLQTALYTNLDASEGGIDQANFAPPAAKCIEAFKGYTFYGDCRTYPVMSLQFISVTGGLAIGDVIRFSDPAGDVNFAFEAAEDASQNEFELFTAGTPSENIEDTMRSLVRVVNASPASRWYARYDSTPVDSPGIISLWGRTQTQENFWLTCPQVSAGDNFEPTLPTTGDAIISDNSDLPGRVYYSKFEEPDHVPLGNFVGDGIGDSEAEVLGLEALRDSIFAIKEDGIFYNSDRIAPFDFREFSETTTCIAPRSIAKLNESILMLSDLGVVSFNEGGISTVSTDIELDIQAIMLRSNARDLVFAEGYDKDRIYILHYPSSEALTYCDEAWVYNVFKQKWHKWRKLADAGIVNSNQRKLYLASPIDKRILVQRDTNTIGDQIEEAYPITITAVSGLSVSFDYDYPLSPLGVGSVISQSGEQAYLETVSVSGNSYDCTIDIQRSFTSGQATVQRGVASHVRWHPDPVQSGAINKTFFEFGVILDDPSVSLITLEQAGSTEGQVREIDITKSNSVGWGDSEWGESEWGDDPPPFRANNFMENVSYELISGEHLVVGVKHQKALERFSLVEGVIIAKVESEIGYKR